MATRKVSPSSLRSRSGAHVSFLSHLGSLSRAAAQAQMGAESCASLNGTIRQAATIIKL